MNINNPDNKPLYIMLIGIPGSGKSTFRHNFIKEHPDFVTISSDDHIESEMKKYNLTYQQYFNYMTREEWTDIHNNLKDKTIEAVKKNKNIIVDLANLTKRNREKKTIYIPDYYYKVAIVFHVNLNEAINRDKTRKISHEIPYEVIKNMYKKFEYPIEEFFDEVIDIK